MIKKNNGQKTAAANNKATLGKIRLNAAGVDLRSEEVYVATREGPAHKFSTFKQ